MRKIFIVSFIILVLLSSLAAASSAVRYLNEDREKYGVNIKVGRLVDDKLVNDCMGMIPKEMFGGLSKIYFIYRPNHRFEELVTGTLFIAGKHQTDGKAYIEGMQNSKGSYNFCSILIQLLYQSESDAAQIKGSPMQFHTQQKLVIVG